MSLTCWVLHITLNEMFKSVCVSVFLLRFTHIYSDCDTSRSCIHWRNSQTEVCDKLLSQWLEIWVV